MKLKVSKGFTLIEVLIASVILFSALAITAELYNASSLSAKKITSRAHFFQITPIAVSSIKASLQQLAENRQVAEFSDELHISGIKYNWHAVREKFSSRAIGPEDITPPRQQFGLFLVSVDASYADNTTKKFSFRVATW